ncbi:phosphopantetheine-binding protein [Streptomyces sp. NPDC004561]
MTIQETTAIRPATREEIENWVVESCRSLGLPAQDATSDFFAIGGTSLAAARLIAAAEELFGEDALPPDDLYENSALSAVAAVIHAHATAGGTGTAA